MKAFLHCVPWLALTSPALADIDQENVPESVSFFSGLGPDSYFAQTFTVGITGKFTGFDVQMTRATVVTEPLLFDIRTTINGRPVEDDSGPNILASGEVAAERFKAASYCCVALPPREVVHIDIDPFAVVAGQVLAIVVHSDDPSAAYLWHGSIFGFDGAAFSRWPSSGGWYFEQGHDHNFRTYVTPIPEPNCAVLALGAIASFIGGRQRRDT